MSQWDWYLLEQKETKADYGFISKLEELIQVREADSEKSYVACIRGIMNHKRR
jgi:hypothetical protein